MPIQRQEYSKRCGQRVLNNNGCERVARLVLVPSPFVGAVSWQVMAEILPDAIVADYGGVSAPDWYGGVARRVAAQSDGRQELPCDRSYRPS